jgi:hypothetical protein
MSDVPQGPGWWQASDDKWYPPPRPTMPGEDQQPGGVAPSAPPEGMAPPAGAPSGPGFGPPMAPPPGAPMGPPGAPMGGPPSYGGYPQGPPPGGGQNRTPLFVALGVVAVAALLGVGLVVAGGGDDDDDPTPSSIETATTSPDDTTGTTGPDSTSEPNEPSEPGSAEDIEVVETGFTNFVAQYDEVNHVSYGYVLENTGDEPVSNIEVTVTLKDGDGTVVSSDTDTIYLIQPGAKVGLGDEPYEEIAEVAEMEVQASVPSYTEPAEELGEITAGDISTTEDSSWKTTFTATSTYEVQLDGPYAYVIYRNTAGDIVGGSYGFMNVVEAGGSTSGEVTSYEPIPGVDPAKTEVYVDPGYIY